MQTTRVPGSRCHVCGKRHSAATATQRQTDQPSPGDYAVCFYCGAVERFTDTLQLVPVTLDADTPTEVLRLVRAIKARTRH